MLIDYLGPKDTTQVEMKCFIANVYMTMYRNFSKICIIDLL